jgi:hypothetical protein
MHRIQTPEPRGGDQMARKHGVLVFLAVALLIAAGGLATRSTRSSVAVNVEVATPAPAAFSDSVGAACDEAPAPQFEAAPDKVPPGCCTTQCLVDKDCNKICGKGVCACIQETSCCRRCVY